MGEINYDLIGEELADAHPDAEARTIALIKNMGNVPLTDDDKKHLAELRKLYGVKD